MIKVTFLFFTISGLLIGQIGISEPVIPKDTAFTVNSAFIKEVKNFPFIKIVQPRVINEIIEEKNVVYSIIGKRKLRLDIFQPKEKKQFYPAVLLVHGGGWRSGDKSHQIPLAMELAAQGFVTASVEYRLSPEIGYPAAIYDLKSAIRWLRAKSKDYNIDTNRIAILGCSSGGHLAAMVGTTNYNPKFWGFKINSDRSSIVQAVIDIDGILDFTDPNESDKDQDPKNPSVGKLWLGYTYKDNPKIWKEASPINYVDKFSPPFLFINSSLARFHAGRDIFINKLNEFGIYSEIHTFPDTPHPFWLFYPWFNSVVNLVVDFLDKVFIFN